MIFHIRVNKLILVSYCINYTQTVAPSQFVYPLLNIFIHHHGLPVSEEGEPWSSSASPDQEANCPNPDLDTSLPAKQQIRLFIIMHIKWRNKVIYTLDTLQLINICLKELHHVSKSNQNSAHLSLYSKSTVLCESLIRTNISIWDPSLKGKTLYMMSGKNVLILRYVNCTIVYLNPVITNCRPYQYIIMY